MNPKIGRYTPTGCAAQHAWRQRSFRTIMQARIEWTLKKMKKKGKEVKIFKELHPKSATFKSRHRSSRGTSTLYKRLRVSNHFHNLFLTSNENLTPTSYTFSEFLSANFRENSAIFTKNYTFLLPEKCWKPSFVGHFDPERCFLPVAFGGSESI